MEMEMEALSKYYSSDVICDIRAILKLSANLNDFYVRKRI